jgi:hypothetical protein
VNLSTITHSIVLIKVTNPLAYMSESHRYGVALHRFVSYFIVLLTITTRSQHSENGMMKRRRK